MIPPALFFFFQDCFGLSGSFVVSTNFRIICSSFVKNIMGIFIGITLNLWIALGRMDTNNTNSSNP